MHPPLPRGHSPNIRRKSEPEMDSESFIIAQVIARTPFLRGLQMS
jgi:hypothetical protein